jgi:uncharacterized protein YkwD
MRGMARWAAALTVVVIGLVAAMWSPASRVGAAGSAASAGSQIEHELIGLINHERAVQGVPALPTADLGAQGWAQHLIATGTLSHASLAADAENLASASTNHTTSDMVVMWMNSPGHRTNMLNPNAALIDVGISCGGGRMVAVARFHNAWAIPTVPAKAGAVPPGIGQSCAGLGLG